MHLCCVPPHCCILLLQALRPCQLTPQRGLSSLFRWHNEMLSALRAASEATLGPALRPQLTRHTGGSSPRCYLHPRGCERGAGLRLLTGRQRPARCRCLCCPRGLLRKANGNVDIWSTVLLEVFSSFFFIVFSGYPAFLTGHVFHCPIPCPVPGVQNRTGSKVNLEERKIEQQCQFNTGEKKSPFNPDYSSMWHKRVDFTSLSWLFSASEED